MPHSNHVLAPMLRKLMRWSTLGADDQQAILGLPFTERAIRRGNYIVREGDTPKFSCLLLSGYAYRHKVVGDGGRQILALHIAGDILDLQNALLRTSDHNVQALSDLRIAELSRQAIQRLAAERPAVAAAMWYDTLVDASVHREWTANVGRRTARTRISHLLCEFGVRLDDAGLGSHCRYVMPMTQEELADAVGLTSVHVNRTLGLSRDGLIDRTRNSVTITDWEQLAAVGDFSPQYLHIQDEQRTN